MANSVFDKIVSGELPSAKVFEDDRVVAVLDINPVNKGHVLVIPKKECRDIYDIPDELFSHVMLVAKKLAPAIKKATGAEGINIIMNNEPAAGQIIFHAHVHIVPRFHGDGFEHWHGKKPYLEGEKEIVAEKIRSALA